MNHAQPSPCRRLAWAGRTAVLLLMVACSSCAWFAPAGPPTDPLYLEATKQFLSQGYDTAIATYSKYIDSNKSSPSVADAYYGRGMCYFAKGNYEEARADFERCLKKTENKDLQGNALMRLGECYMREERFRKAEETYRRLLDKFPTTAKRDDVLYYLGVACLREAKWDEAENYLGQVIRNYPYSPRRTLAQEKMPGVDRFFSVQVMAVQTRSKADAVAAEMAKKGLDSFIRTINRSGDTYYCVRTGKFSSWEEVKRHAQQVEAAGFKGVMKVP